MIFDRILQKFIIVGMVNTVVGMCVMFVLYNVFGFSYWISSTTNYVVGSVISFFLNKFYTFNIKRWSVFMAVAFIVTIAFSYLIAYGISKPAIKYILRNSPQKVCENIALFTGMCLFTLLNYLGQRFFVFKQR